jgi:CRISPR-associated protein Csx10
MKIKLTLISDTAPGSGEGLAGIIDRDVNFDSFGLPYIPAKRIKGLLREAAMDYLEQKTGSPESPEFDLVFGRPGVSESTSVGIGNGLLADYDVLKTVLGDLPEDYKPVFSPEYVSECYSVTRAQTAIERQNGTAEENTLRITRLLRKNSEFVFDLAFRQPPTEDQIDLLRNACKLTRSMGLSRTRGLGEVKLELMINPLAATAQAPVQAGGETDDFCQLEYTIESLGQLICTASVCGNFVVSDPYIPGRQILGLFAGRYVGQHGLGSQAHLNADFRRLFLDGEVIFENAYLCDHEGNRLLPVPTTLVQDKETENLYDLAYQDDWKAVVNQEIQTRPYDRSFCRIAGTDLLNYQPLMEAEYHHCRPEHDRGFGHAVKGKGEFFQVEVIKDGQKFKGILKGARTDLEVLRTLIPDGSVVHLGKSKTAQYGRAKMNYSELTCLQTAGEEDLSDEVQDELIISLTSPMVLVNEFGHIMPDPQLFLEELKARLQLHEKMKEEIYLDPKDCFLKFVDIGGYMGRWGLPLPQARALDTGTVFKILSGIELDKTSMEIRGYGLFTTQGYGTIKVNWHGDRHLTIGEPGAMSGVLPEPLPDAFQDLATQILSKRLQAQMHERALRIFDDHHFSKGKKLLTNALISRLISVFEGAADCDAILRDIGDFKDLAKKKMDDLKLTIDNETKDLFKWMTILLDNNLHYFQEKVIQQTPGYWNAREVKHIHDLLPVESIVSRTSLVRLAKDFFLTFFNRMLWHNRGAA